MPTRGGAPGRMCFSLLHVGLLLRLHWLRLRERPRLLGRQHPGAIRIRPGVELGLPLGEWCPVRVGPVSVLVWHEPH